MSPRPRIALNAHLLSGERSYRTAGIHGYIYNTLIRLPGAAPDLDYTLFASKGRLPNDRRFDVRTSSLPTGNPVIRILWEQIVAPLELARLRPSLLHGMAFTLPLLWHGLSVVTLFDLSFIRYPGKLSKARKAYLSLFTRLSARKARRVIAISQHAKSEIQSLLGIEDARIDVAVPGVSPDFRPQPAGVIQEFRARQSLPERYILHVGTLEPRKNLETLVRAYARLVPPREVKLVLVGAKGWQFEPLLRLIDELDLKEDVILAGYPSTEVLPLWYCSAEIFVFPSLYEGFGLPVLEAMACGLPVIAANTSSLPEVIGTDGIQIPPTDVAAWADAIAKLVDNPTMRADLGARGQARAAMFTWDNTAQQMVAAYRAALKTGSI
jgi:glycosyltransferase involved in cell wall biosynthesis